MATKPTVKPRWATDDVTDPGSGTDNVEEPSETKKDRGWDDQEIPPRQWWNWLWRIAYRWIDWLDGTTIPLTSTDLTANEQKADGTGHTHEITGFLRTSELLQEIEDEGAAAQAIAQENIGLPVFSDEVQLTSGLDPQGASIFCYRIGNLVTITTTSLALSASDSEYQTSISAISTDFAPTNTITNVTVLAGNAAIQFTVEANGRARWNLYDTTTGNPLSTTSISAATISYYKHPDPA